MNKIHLVVLCFCIVLISCVGHSVTSQDLNGLDIGKNQTAIHGLINSVEEIDQELRINLTVLNSRQGGATSPAIAKGVELEAVCSPIFMRAYKDRTGSEVSATISKAQEVIIYITKSIKNPHYSVNHLDPLAK